MSALFSIDPDLIINEEPVVLEDAGAAGELLLDLDHEPVELPPLLTHTPGHILGYLNSYSLQSITICYIRVAFVHNNPKYKFFPKTTFDLGRQMFQK